MGEVWYHAGMNDKQIEDMIRAEQIKAMALPPLRNPWEKPTEPDNDPVLGAIDEELAYIRSKIAYLERRDGIR